MANKKIGMAGKVLGGALIAGALGVAAGMLLAPKSGKNLRKDLHVRYADFYKFIAPKVKSLKNMTETQYHEYVKKAIGVYAKARKLSTTETKELLSHAQTIWKTVKKHF